MKQHKHSTADYTIDTKMSYFSFHKCMIFFFLLQLFLLFNSNVFGQTECNCSKAFEEVQNIAQENYAGYDYNVNLHGKANYKKLCRKLKKKVKHTNNKQECEAQLIKYAQFFKDKHFNIITEDLMEQLESSNLPPEFTMYKNGKVSYLKVPSFDLEYKAKIDSLLLANHKKIIQSEVFIIDVSDNEGGSDDAYSSLTPYYYTNPYTVEGVDFKASKGNIEEFELYLTYTDYFDEETLKGIQKWLTKQKAILVRL